MKKAIEEQTFAGKTITVYPHGPDFEIQIDGDYFGVYLSPAAGINAVQKHITGTIDERKP